MGGRFFEQVVETTPETLADAEALLGLQDGLGREVGVPDLVARACAMGLRADPGLDAALGVDHSDTKHALSGAKGVHVRESITVHASPEELYTFWRRLEQLPSVMPHLESVEQIDFKHGDLAARFESNLAEIAALRAESRQRHAESIDLARALAEL